MEGKSVHLMRGGPTGGLIRTYKKSLSPFTAEFLFPCPAYFVLRMI